MVDKAGIYIDLYKLRKLLKRAQYMMTKTDRIILRIVAEVSPRWLKYIHYNPERVCFQATSPYKERLQQNLNIILT